MVKITKVKSGDTNLTFNKKKIHYKEFKAETRISRAGVITMLKGLIKNGNLEKGKTYIFSGAWKQTGWKSGKAFTIDSFSSKSVYDFCDEYNLKQVNQDCQFFSIYEYATPSKKGGSGGNNDCFYKALHAGLNQRVGLFPEEINNRIKLKSHLKLTRSSKISIDKVKSLIPLLAEHNISIQIEGDYKLQSEVQEHDVKMTLKDGHYEFEFDNQNYIDKLKSSMKDIRGVSTYDRKLYSYYIDIENNKIYYFDGKSTKEYDSNDDINNQMRFSIKYILIKSDTFEDLQKTRKDYDENMNILMKETNGKIDLRKFKNIKNCAINTFLDMFQQRNIVVQPLLEQEDEWLYNYYHVGGGGWIYHENGYEGEGHTIDRNSSYPSHYDSGMLTPVGQPTFQTLKESELKHFYDELKFEFGLYRAIITNPKNINHKKYFKLRADNLYMHTDLKHAQEIGLKVNLIEDNEVNAMIYDKSVLISSASMFHEYIQYFYDLKKRDIKIGKSFLNVFSGAMSKLNKQFKQTSKTETVEISDKDIINIRRVGDEHSVLYMDKNRHFMYPFARQTICCVNKMKLYLQKLIIKYEANVVYCHTDSLILNDENIIKEFKIGKGLSQWKKETEGECNINNGKVTWKNKDGDYVNKKLLSNNL